MAIFSFCEKTCKIEIKQFSLFLVAWQQMITFSNQWPDCFLFLSFCIYPKDFYLLHLEIISSLWWFWFLVFLVPSLEIDYSLILIFFFCSHSLSLFFFFPSLSGYLLQFICSLNIFIGCLPFYFLYFLHSGFKYLIFQNFQFFLNIFPLQDSMLFRCFLQGTML